MAKNLTQYTKDEWVPILLPKVALQKLLKESLEAERTNKSYLARLKDLQKAFKEAKLFEGMREGQIIEKLRETREQIWREKYAKYYHNC